MFSSHTLYSLADDIRRSKNHDKQHTLEQPGNKWLRHLARQYKDRYVRTSFAATRRRRRGLAVVGFAAAVILLLDLGFSMFWYSSHRLAPYTLSFFSPFNPMMVPSPLPISHFHIDTSTRPKRPRSWRRLSTWSEPPAAAATAQREALSSGIKTRINGGKSVRVTLRGLLATLI
jgi:hypothetical protein